MPRTTIEEIQQRPFVERALTVKAYAFELFDRYLPGFAPDVDYLSIFTAGETDYEQLKDQAQRLGAVVFDKNGPVYRLRREGKAERLPSDIVQVREPRPARPEWLIGSADFVMPYPQAKAVLAGRDNCREELKGNYTMLTVSDPTSRVMIHLPSQQLTKTMMGL